MTRRWIGLNARTTQHDRPGDMYVPCRHSDTKREAEVFTADEVAVRRAGGTGIEPAICGCGACCRAFSSVQGRTRTPLKWVILTVQSTGRSPAFTSVHRRWGQQWGQTVQASTLIESGHLAGPGQDVSCVLQSPEHDAAQHRAPVCGGRDAVRR